MCDMRYATTLNFKTSLPHHPLSEEKITDKFMARKMLSAGARADARKNLVEIIETKLSCTLACCAQLAPSFQNKSNPREPPTNTSNGTYTNCRHHRTKKNLQDNSNYTELNRLVFPSANQNIHNCHVGGRCIYFCADCKICSKPHCSCWQK